MSKETVIEKLKSCVKELCAHLGELELAYEHVVRNFKIIIEDDPDYPLKDALSELKETATTNERFGEILDNLEGTFVDVYVDRDPELPSGLVGLDEALQDVFPCLVELGYIFISYMLEPPDETGFQMYKPEYKEYSELIAYGLNVIANNYQIAKLLGLEVNVNPESLPK